MIGSEGTRTVTYVGAVREALAQALTDEPNAFILGEEVGVYGGVFRATEGLRAKFGRDRVRDTPIAEVSIVGMAVGAAIVGCRPIVEIMFMDFIASAMDPIVNHAAKLRSMSGGQIRASIIIRTQAGTGTQHGSQHSQMLESWFTHVPGLFVALPSTPADVLGLYKSAMKHRDPVLFIEHRQLYRTSGPVADPPQEIPFGSASVRRNGRDVTIVATANMVTRTLQAAGQLARDGIEAEVIDPRTLVPLDLETILSSVRRTGRLLVVHEEVERSGWGGELVAEVVARAFDHLDAPPSRLGAKNVPIPFGNALESMVVPQVDSIVQAARNLLDSRADPSAR